MRSLINLALLCGHVGRYGSGVCPLRGQNNVQGGGDMGAIPNKFPGGQDVEDPDSLRKFELAWNVTLPRGRGWNLTDMFHAAERGELDTLYIIGENPAQSEADQEHAVGLLRGLRHLIVQDIFLTKTGELAEVVFPASASWCEAEGTVTSSERRVQRCRKALEPPGEARDDIAILCELARRLGHEWPEYSAQQAWDECRSLSPWHAGMSYARLDALGGLQWPCYDENHPGELFLHARLWHEPRGGPAAPFAAVDHDPPVEALDDEYPVRLTTGRRLDSFNTGVQSGGYASPMRRGETLDISPEDARRYAVADGDRVRVTSRRGSVVVPVRVDPGLRAGARVYDLPSQRRRRDQPADDRRDRSQVGHRGVQGVRGAHRAARTRGRGDVSDLHFTSATATGEERAAVDALLGPHDDGAASRTRPAAARAARRVRRRRLDRRRRA